MRPLPPTIGIPRDQLGPPGTYVRDSSALGAPLSTAAVMSAIRHQNYP